MSQASGVRSQEAGVRSQESEVRGQEAGGRRQGIAVRCWLLAIAALLAMAPMGVAQEKSKTKAAAAHDFVFLAEDRPVLIRIHVRIDGKTLDDAGMEFIEHIFQHLDTKRRGYLTQAEVERLPMLSHMQMGGLASPFGGGFGSSESAVKMADVDTNKDGKVTPAELAAHYRTKGFVPIQVHADKQNQDRYMMMAMETGAQAEPDVDAVRAAIFSLFDAKKSGKLTRADLVEAPKILLRHDENEDEMITGRELAGNFVPKYSDMRAPPATKAMPDKTATKDLPKKEMPKKEIPKKMPKPPVDDGPPFITPLTNPRDSMVMMLPAPGEAPPELINGLLKRYGAKSGKGLTREAIGLDEATFKLLDVNNDGFLDAKELAAFVQRPPDLEIMVNLGSPGDVRRGVELLKQKGRPALLAAHANAFDGLAMIDLVKTRFELRGQDETEKDTFGPFLRIQYSVFFTQVDKNGDGYIDLDEIKDGNKFGMGGMFTNVFKAMDADGDGKVSKREFDAYLDFLADAKVRLHKACVSLALTNESRGLFDMLDTNRDGRLSVREMRGGVALFDKLDRGRKGFITAADIPSSYRLTLRRGPAGSNGDDYSALLSAIYGGSAKTEAHRTLTAGPLWFRKMDKNRDGDVSRKEWLGSEELFRQIDTDGDGLISAEEADRFDKLHRKGK